MDNQIMTEHNDEPDKKAKKGDSNNSTNTQPRRRSLLIEKHSEEADNNGKVADSAYSNSCSNSQSRRSTSSKSTHSGSNSSGYGGKISTNGSSDNLNEAADLLKDKEIKRKKQIALDPPKEEESVELENVVSEEVNIPDIQQDYVVGPSLALAPAEVAPAEFIEIPTTDLSTFKEEVIVDGFSCVISIHDGLVMYTTSSLTSSLGFPKDIWIGRSFMNFIHPKDCNTFASHILGLISPKIVNGIKTKGLCQSNAVTTIFCRIRKYRGLTACGFGVKECDVIYLPFLLKFTFKNINEDEGTAVYLVIHATQCCSAYKSSCEVISKAIPFVIRHIANGNFEYLDPESVSYLGYFPQDVNDRCALRLYHPEDMAYLREIYEIIVKEGSAPRTRPYRMLAQNGDYIKLETEWSSFINPWSRKLEFVIGKHHVVQGPLNPDVFSTNDLDKIISLSDDQKINTQLLRESIVRIMNEVLTKPAEVAKQQMSKRCQDLTTFMEKLLEEQKSEEPLKTRTGNMNSYYEHDSVMLGGISPHRDSNESDSSTGTPLKYNQLNYTENIQRYFNSHEPFVENDAENPDTNMRAIEESHHDSSKKSTVDNGSGNSSSGATSSSDSSCINLPDYISSCDGLSYTPVRLTESILNKHNTEMEKKLIKKHRKTRADKEELPLEHKPKKKDYLKNSGIDAHNKKECNQGIKRACRHFKYPVCKHQKVALVRQPWKRNTVVPMQVETWNNPAVNVHHMPLVRPVPGMIPLYYLPTHNTLQAPSTETSNNCATPVQYMMCPNAVFGTPIVLSQLPPASYGPVTHTMTREEQTTPHYSTTASSMGLTWSNYDKVCNTGLPYNAGKHIHCSSWREKKFKEPQPSTSKVEPREGIISSTNALNRSTEAVPESSMPPKDKTQVPDLNHGEETYARTDGESSYSSYYSSLLKTPENSQSADDSVDSKNATEVQSSTQVKSEGLHSSEDKFKEFQIRKKEVTKRKMEPPWMEKVSLTPEMIFKYKLNVQNESEVLTMDKEKMVNMQQPSLVNEQLGQLYLDMQLAGVAAQLTLEEGYTSESSDENMLTAKANWKYSKLSILYEDDAPLPPLPKPPHSKIEDTSAEIVKL